MRKMNVKTVRKYGEEDIVVISHSGRHAWELVAAKIAKPEKPL